jgi:hypothetical protein
MTAQRADFEILSNAASVNVMQVIQQILVQIKNVVQIKNTSLDC